MNWLTILIITVFIFCVLNGLRRGFIRTVAAMTSILISMVLVYFLNPYVAGFIRENTPVYQNVEERCAESLLETFETRIGNADQNQLIQELSLPENMKQMLLETLDANQAGDTLADSLAKEAAGLIADMAVNGIAFLVTLILVSVLLRMLVSALDGIFRLPVLSFVNRLGGAAAGCVQGLLFIWIFCLAVALFWNTVWGRDMAALLEASPLTQNLYDMNPLVKFISFMK